MADRQWFAEGIGVYEEGEEEYFVEGVQIAEDQAATASVDWEPYLEKSLRRRLRPVF